VTIVDVHKIAGGMVKVDMGERDGVKIDRILWMSFIDSP